VLGAGRFDRLETVAGDLHRAISPDEGLDDAVLAANGRARGVGIDRLAARLRRRLGPRDSARLAALLVSDASGRVS
jgi:hypothetical protein